MPPSTRGRRSFRAYTRRPGLETRLMPVITRSRPFPYFSSTTSVSKLSPFTMEKSRMYPSSLRMRAICALRREVGISVRSCIALLALRIRVSMSAIGSVSILRSSPRALRHAGDDALVGEIAQADPADPELAIHGTRAPTACATAVLAHLEALRPGRLSDHGLLRHATGHLSQPRTEARARAGVRAPRHPSGQWS